MIAACSGLRAHRLPVGHWKSRATKSLERLSKSRTGVVIASPAPTPLLRLPQEHRGPPGVGRQCGKCGRAKLSRPSRAHPA